MNEALKIEGLAVGYTNPEAGVTEVVRDVSLTLRRGTVVGLAGESGCGKSTTALAATGYQRHDVRLLGGSSVLGGATDLLRQPREALRHIWGTRLAYIGQNASTTLNPALTVGTQLEHSLNRRTLGRDGVRRRKIELLELMGLHDAEDALNRYPHEFSGGQQQRVALALALTGSPEVLILDEPTTGLDVTTQALVTKLLKSLVAQSDLAILYVSHDLALLSTIADDLAIMYAGQIAESGSFHGTTGTPLHPYTQALLEAVPSASRERRLRGIAGRPPAAVVTDRCAFADRCPHSEPECVVAGIELSVRGADHLVRCRRAGDVRTVATPGDRRVHGDPAAPILKVDQLTCVYRHNRQSVTALDDVSLELGTSEAVGIVGESGSGKSTLLRAIIGLVEPSAGTISLNGETLPARAVKRSRDVRKDIQLVFQNPESSLNPRHSVGTIIGRSIRLLRADVARDEVEHAVSESLEAVHLERRLAHRYPFELSGGQKQRVALARAFAMRPSVLLCDEVTSALDVSVQAAILELIASLSQDFGTAVVFVTHDLGVARSITSRAIVLKDGSRCEEGAIGQLFDSPTHEYTRALLSALPAFR